MTGAEVLIALFVLFVICRGRIEPGGRGVDPDEARRRQIEQQWELRGRGGE